MIHIHMVRGHQHTIHHLRSGGAGNVWCSTILMFRYTQKPDSGGSPLNRWETILHLSALKTTLLILNKCSPHKHCSKLSMCKAHLQWLGAVKWMNAVDLCVPTPLKYSWTVHKHKVADKLTTILILFILIIYDFMKLFDYTIFKNNIKHVCSILIRNCSSSCSRAIPSKFMIISLDYPV